MRANLGFIAPPVGFDRLDIGTQLEMMRERFRGVGRQVDRILDGFAARPDQYYCERFGLVRVPTWSHGRVAVVGDVA